MRCPACDGSIPEDARFCPACGTASRVPGTDTQATRTSVSGDVPSGSRTSGVRAADAARDVARFPPGTILAERYRIVGLLGRGGMGEVYRADDLKLGRTVALKFLPESMERDPGRLVRLLNEVRTAVRVTHPNVCRVHDIAEFDGRHYLSMEYVDGEDLGTLLRRIGRLPGDRAVRVARQLCAGLGAAHAQGVLHRDLKPANVMIDGRGEVKITDFGLAGAAEDFDGAEIRVGTPAYMAPEQVEGREVTTRSDLYALGLVLYELFSGKPAFADRTPDGIARRASSQPPSLTTAVDDVDPVVAKVVERCLSPDPDDRPPSAVAVSAALPGGDPLAAALAAGETPSPELVAQAGSSGGLRVRSAVALLVVTLLGAAAAAWLSSETTFAGRAGLDRSPTVLIDRAEQILRDLDREDALVGTDHAWIPNWPYYQAVRTRDTAFDRWDDLARTRPATLLFAFRGSPRDLVRFSQGSIGNQIGDPPPYTPGMVELLLDPVGRLLAFRAVPERIASGEDAPGADGEDVDFTPFFEAAGLDPATFEEAAPTLHPRSYADRRYAWVGIDPFVEGGSPHALRIEASSLRGTPLSFETLDPWELPSATGETYEPSFWARAADWLGSASFLVVVIGAAIVAVRNARLGRGDHRTALRFGLYLAGVRLAWLLAADPRGSAIGTLTAHLAWSSYRLFLSYLFYMALEPYARRLWPEMLVSWVRVFGGRLRDARVGRDVLIGVATGSAMAVAKYLFSWISNVVRPSNNGLDTLFWSWESLRGVRSAIVAMFGIHVSAVLDGLNAVMLFLVLRVVLRNTVAAVVGTTALALVMFNPGAISNWPYLASFAIVAALFWVVLFRAGLLAILVAYSIDQIARGVRVTADLGAWHALPMWLAFGSILLVAAWGFRYALAGRALFRDEIRTGNPIA